MVSKIFLEIAVCLNHQRIHHGEGGYVGTPEALTQSDTPGLLFNNEIFTDRNLNALANNDLIRTPSIHDPVSTVTGNMYHDETDITIRSVGLDYTPLPAPATPRPSNRT
uniref:Uncharacterized protein n=1 Tax=Candidatus Kentrum sp. LFY TaxID=2126342 RepID=A0A450WIE8_9GAMM|nr:MAG: hypothetical protein BECKLFY1418C_GA0070996_10264 [Candidatus Kentron sp. LFY]